MILTGGLNDNRGRAWHGLGIRFRTEDNPEWQTGTVHKAYASPTVVKLGDHKFVLGWKITEFEIQRGR